MSALHIEDIRADLERSDRSGMEEAFRALVGWPDEADIEGADEVGRKALLRELCERLIEVDIERQMPGYIADRIADETDDIAGGTYADGARVVLSTPAFFDHLAD